MRLQRARAASPPMKLIHLFFAGALLAAGTAVHADPAYPQVERLRTELDKYAAGLKPDQRSRYGGDAGLYLQSALARAAGELSSGNFEAADQQLRSLAQLAPAPAVLKLVDELSAAVLAERNKRNAETLARVDALVARTAEACLKARTEKELDQLQLDLAQERMGFNRNNSSELLQRAAQKVDAAANFARRWQDYLAQLNAGNTQAAAQVMTELAGNNNYNYPILPRSELLARSRVPRAETPPPAPAPAPAPAPVPAAALFLENVTLDNLAATMARIPRLPDGRPPNQEYQGVISALGVLQGGVSALAAGNISAALQAASSNSTNFSGATTDNLPVFAELRRQLVIRIIPHYLSLPEKLQPRAEDNPADYFTQLLRQSTEANDWALTSRALEAYGRLCFPGNTLPEWVTNNRGALNQYLIGLGQEKAGEWSNALSSFSSALRVPAQYLPVDDLAARIKSVRKAQQAETDAARLHQQQEAEAAARRLREAQAPH